MYTSIALIINQFIQKLPSKAIKYLHVAGHFQQSDELTIDTHGADVKPDVWQLLQFTYQQHGYLPTLLERDFNIPKLDSIEKELLKIRATQAQSHTLDHKAG